MANNGTIGTWTARVKAGIIKQIRRRAINKSQKDEKYYRKRLTLVFFVVIMSPTMTVGNYVNVAARTMPPQYVGGAVRVCDGAESGEVIRDYRLVSAGGLVTKMVGFLRALGIAILVAAVGGCGDSGGLISAADKGDITEVKRLLDEGADIDTKNILGGTPLSAAAGSGQTETVLFLIKAGANVNAKNTLDTTPLHSAASREIVFALIEAGADINAKNLPDHTPLHSAASFGRTEAALALVEAGANINEKNKKGWTPLFEAVYGGHTETALALIKAGSGEAGTALEVAIEVHGNDSAIALSLQSAMDKHTTEEQK